MRAPPQRCGAASRIDLPAGYALPSQGFRLVRVRAADAAEPKSPRTPDAAEVAVHRIDVWHNFDKGQPSKAVSGPALVLSLSGRGVAEAKAVRTVVKSAADDAGNPLKPPVGMMMPAVEDSAFGPPRILVGPARGGKPSPQEFEQRLQFFLPNGVRSIKTLAGTVELLIPANDPGSAVAASFASDAGRPLKSEVLRAAGVEITLKKPGADNTLSYEIRDPKNRVGAVEFSDAGGTKLETVQASRGSSTFGNTTTFFVDTQMKSTPPADAVAKIYLVTDKSLVAVPFEFKDIPVRK